MATIFRQVETMWNNGTLPQLIRFGFAGLALTALYAGIYWPLATYVMLPVIAGLVGFAVAAVAGYFVHSAFSFKGHGSRDNPAMRQRRFLIVQFGGFLLNEVFIWVLTGPLLHGPTWWPLVPTVFVTPFLTFLINRAWVFG